MKKKPLAFAVFVVLAIVALLAGSFCYISSGHFIKAHVLPRVAKALGTEVQVGDVSFSALSSIELKELRIGSEADPLLRAGIIRVRYHALAFLSGRVEVNEVLLDEVRIDATPEKLEALAASRPPPEKAPPEPKPGTKAPELMVKNVKVQNLSLRYVQSGTDGERVDLQVAKLDVGLPELAGGKAFQLTIAARAKAVIGERIDADIGDLSMVLSGMIAENLLPTQLSLDAHLAGISGTAGPVGLDGRRIQLIADVEEDSGIYAIKLLDMVEYIGDDRDAALEMAGSLGVVPSLSASFDASLSIPPGSLLNVVGALAGGLEFDQTSIAYDGHIEMPAPGMIATRGALNMGDLTVAVPSAGIPALRPMQVAASHDLEIDLDGKSITLTELDLSVSDGGRDVVRAKLDHALTLDMQQPGGDAAGSVSVKVDRFDLTLLNAFLARKTDVRILKGELNRAVNIDISDGGRKVRVNVGGGGIDKLVLRQGDRQIGPLRIDHEANLRVTDFSTLHIDHFQVAIIPLAAGPVPAATVQLGGEWTKEENPVGKLDVRLEGNGQKLAFLAKPFLDARSLGTIQPVLSGNLPIAFKAELHAELADGTAKLAPGFVHVDGLGRERLIEVNLGKTAFALDDLNQAPEKIMLPLGFAVNDLQLAKVLPFVPPEAGLARLSGNLNVKGTADVAGSGQSLHLETQAGIEDAGFMLRDGTRLAAPVSPSLDLALDYAAGGWAGVERLDAILRQPGRQEPLLHLVAKGGFDTGMDPNARNVLDVSTRGTVQLDALQKLVISPEKESRPAPQTVTKTRENPSPPNLWIAVTVAMEKAVQGELLIQDLAAEAEYRNGVLDLSNLEALVNDGSVAANGTCDFSNMKSPGYDFRIDAGGFQFAPVLSTFIPNTALYTRGGLKQAKIELRGAGFDMASLQSNLVAKVDAQLDRIAVERMSGTAGKLTEALLLGMFSLGWSDLGFSEGELRIAIDEAQFIDHDIHVQTLRLQGPSLLLDGSGTVQFGGTWNPDMEIKTGFSGAKADSLRRRGYAIASESDDAGYFAGPSIPLRGDLTSLRNQASLVTEVLVRSGKLNAKDAMKADLVNQILGSLGENGDAGKPDVGGIIGGILGGVLDSQQPSQDQDQNDSGDDAAEAVGNILRGIFGN